MELDLPRSKLSLDFAGFGAIETPRSSLHLSRDASRKSPFYLPLEIRRLIYRYLYQPDRVDVVLRRLPHPYHGGSRKKEWDSRGPAWTGLIEWERKLLAISPAIYDEAIEFIWRPLRFRFIAPDDMRDFLREIGPKSRRYIAGADIPAISDMDGLALHDDALDEGVRLLQESQHLSWVKITVRDYDLAMAGEENYKHPASHLRGLKKVELLRHVHLGRVVPDRRGRGLFPSREGRGNLVDGEACTRYWEDLTLQMRQPA